MPDELQASPELSEGCGFDILKLPHELIIHLLKFVPLSQLPIIACLCKTLRDAAEDQLWRELWLMEPKAFHESYPPSASPLPMEEMVRRRDEIRTAARNQILGILIAGNKRPERFNAVTTINARTYRFSCHHVVTILALVRSHLTTLRVQCANRNIEFSKWGPYDGFYAKMADFDRDGFPWLTHLDLTPCHNASYGQILLVVSLAPRILFLRIAARDELQEVTTPLDPDEEPWTGLPIMHHLRHIIFDFPDDDGLPLMCRQILDKSPNLERLLVADIWADLEEDGWSDEEQGESTHQFDYFTTLSMMPRLRHLDWRCGSYYVFERLLRPDQFANLQILAIDGNLWSEERERIEAISIPPLRNLETLVLRARHGLRAEIIKAEQDVSDQDDIEETQRISMTTLFELSGAPKLSTILFTHDEDIDMVLRTPPREWRQNGVRGVSIIRSQDGTNSLIHLRTLTRARLPIPSGESSPSNPTNPVEERDEDEYTLSEGLLWEQAVAYNGQHVPAEVMDRAFQPLGSPNWRFGQYTHGGDLSSDVWTVLKAWNAERWAASTATVDELKDLTLGTDEFGPSLTPHELAARDD